MPPLKGYDMAHAEHFEAVGTHRLIAAVHDIHDTLARRALSEDILTDLNELEGATDERKLALHSSSTVISSGELLFGVPGAQVVNAAFCRPGIGGGRFHDDRRGAWYAGMELETSMREVAFHKKRFLTEARIAGRHTFEYVEYLADFSGQFHHLDEEERARCLRPAPIPECYRPSQALARTLLYSGASGIVYPSVRHEGGTCIACFRPALVFQPQRVGPHRVDVESEYPTLRLVQ